MSVLTSVRSKVAAARRALATASGSVADIRDAIAKLRDERRAVEAAPIPSDEALPVLDQTVDRLLAGLSQYTSVDDVVAGAAHGRTVDMRALSLEQRGKDFLREQSGSIRRQRQREPLHLNVPCSGGGSPAYLEIDKLADGRYRATVGTLFEHQEICRTDDLEALVRQTNAMAACRSFDDVVRAFRAMRRLG